MKVQLARSMDFNLVDHLALINMKNILFFALAMGTLLCQFHGLHLVFHCMVWRLESFEGIFRGRMDAGHELGAY
jgi:hypothetical protein